MALGALLACAALALALALTGCGGDDEPTAGKREIAELRVGTLPAAAAAPLFLGVEKGFFEQEKLKIEPHLSEGGAEVVASVVSQDNQIGFSGIVPLIVAKAKGVPIQLVAGGARGGATQETDWAAAVVVADGPIREPADLEGKTIAVNAVNGQVDVMLKATLARRGVDVSRLKWLEVPFPEMDTALDRGGVDAIAPTEPFVTRSLRYASEHPAETRRAAMGFTKIPAKVADTMVMPTFQPGLDPEQLQLAIDATDRYGTIERKPTLEELLRR